MPLSAPRTCARSRPSAVNSVICVSSVIDPAGQAPVREAGHAEWTEPAPDLLEAHELDRSTQSVAHRAAQQTAAEMADVCESAHVAKATTK